MCRVFFLAFLLGWFWLGQALGQVSEDWYNHVARMLTLIQDDVSFNSSSWGVMLEDQVGTFSQVKQWHDVDTLVKVVTSFGEPLVATTNILTGSTNMLSKTRDDMNAWLSQIDQILGELVIVSGAAAKEDSVTNKLNEVIDNTAGLLTESTYLEIESGHEFFLERILSSIIEVIQGDTGPDEDYEQSYETPEGTEYDTPQADETPDNDYNQTVNNEFDDGAIDHLQSAEFSRVYEGAILPFFAQLQKGDWWGDSYRMPNSLPMLDAITIGDYTIDSFSLPVEEGSFAGVTFRLLHDLSATGYAIGFVWSLILLGRREYRYYMSLGRDGGGE